MYLSKIIFEQEAGAGKRRVYIEKPIELNGFIVKAVFRCGSEDVARKYADFLLGLKNPVPAQMPVVKKKSGNKTTLKKEAAKNAD